MIFPVDNRIVSIKPVHWLWHFRSLLQNHSPDGTNEPIPEYAYGILSTVEGVPFANKRYFPLRTNGCYESSQMGKIILLDNMP